MNVAVMTESEYIKHLEEENKALRNMLRDVRRALEHIPKPPSVAVAEFDMKDIVWSRRPDGNGEEAIVYGVRYVIRGSDTTYVCLDAFDHPSDLQLTCRDSDMFEAIDDAKEYVRKRKTEEEWLFCGCNWTRYRRFADLPARHGRFYNGFYLLVEKSGKQHRVYVYGKTVRTAEAKTFAAAKQLAEEMASAPA